MPECDCPECGKRIRRVPAGGEFRFCSKRCKDTHHQRIRRGRIKSLPAPVERITLAALYERDGGRCGLCGEPVDKILRGPNPGAASVDHVIALTRGGTHTWRNVQLAHFGCNSAKGNR